MAILSSLVVRILGDSKGFQDSMTEAQQKTAAFGERLTSMGKGLTLGVTAPIVALGAASVKMAADAGEAASKMEAVFGGATQRMNQWIGELRDTVPATTHQLQGMAAEIQDLLVPIGMVPDAAESMTKQIVQLAADLASFNNIPMSEALERIRAGLVGQNEPLLKFGVALNAGMVEAEALARGLIAEGEALDAAARAQTVFQLILERTTAAHGDAARTAESTANQMKFLKANLMETAVTIGNQLLPVVTPLIAGLASFVSWVGSLNPAILQTGIVLAGVAAAAGPVLIALGSLISLAATLGVGIGAMLAIVSGIGIVFAAVVAAGVLIIRNWDDIKAGAAALAEKVRVAVELVRTVFDGMVKFVVGLLKILYRELDDVFNGKLSALVGIARQMIDGYVAFWREVGQRVKEIVVQIYEAIREQLVGRFTAVVDSVKEKVEAIGNFFKDLYTKVAGGSYVPDMMDVVWSEFHDRLGTVKDAVDTHTGAMKGHFQDLNIVATAEAAALLEKMKGLLDTKFATDVVAKIKGHVQQVKDEFLSLKNTVTGFVSGLVDSIKGELLDRLKDIIKDFLTNWDKIVEAVKKVVEAVKKLAGTPREFSFDPTLPGGGLSGFVIDFRPLQEIGQLQIELLASIRDAIVDLGTRLPVLVGVDPQSGGLATAGAGTTRVAGATVIRIDRVDVHGVQDPEGFYRELARVAERERRRGGVTPLDFATA